MTSCESGVPGPHRSLVDRAKDGKLYATCRVCGQVREQGVEADYGWGRRSYRLNRKKQERIGR